MNSLPKTSVRLEGKSWERMAKIIKYVCTCIYSTYLYMYYILLGDTVYTQWWVLFVVYVLWVHVSYCVPDSWLLLRSSLFKNCSWHSWTGMQPKFPTTS